MSRDFLFLKSEPKELTAPHSRSTEYNKTMGSACSREDSLHTLLAKCQGFHNIYPAHGALAIHVALLHFI